VSLYIEMQKGARGLSVSQISLWMLSQRDSQLHVFPSFKFKIHLIYP